MKYLFLKICLFCLFLLLFTGCAIGVPQNRDEFVAMYSESGIFTAADHYTINQPAKAVIADVKEYSQKCLNVQVYDSPNYALRETGGKTTYRPKIETVRKNVFSLSVQEEYNDHHISGSPKDGLFTLVAEITPAGKGKTKLDIYHPRGSKTADPLKDWAEGKKGSCPNLRRGY
ncbi:lipoprotein, putative [Geotalea daltonii FRC-32]|uniref:Lipoprotein, putative n=1 Tax=Geotalea daltonii (strain DSM 22248 / JCM 15807 / FRC-32) TaxID=316067 RepID=B9M1J4_GEODF|nr:hypothetical protein [Geotalea daltonii]ACM21076.1 lipoprotein, putative [Geotalea daltonii FRC-32]